MGLFSLIGGFLGGNAQKKASKKATAAQVAALNRGIDLQQQQYAQTREDYAPATAQLAPAIKAYADLIGSNGADAQAAGVAGLKADPFFQQNLADANTNLLQNASATGGIRGGDTQGAIGELSPRLLQAYYQNALGNYSNLASLGLGAVGNVANLGAQNAQSVSNLYGDIGTAQARNALTIGGINAANFNNIGGFLDKATSAIIPGGGGSSLSGAFKSIFG